MEGGVPGARDVPERQQGAHRTRVCLDMLPQQVRRTQNVVVDEQNQLARCRLDAVVPRGARPAH